MRDYRLYELNDEEFEGLIVRICVRWLGPGVIPFAAGKDGGRDGKFNGIAQSFPSTASPLNGKTVLQAKHVAAPNKSCSDRDFERLLKNEHRKIKALIKAGICDHYIVFANRKLTGGAEAKLVAGLMKLGLKSAHIVGAERLHLALEDYHEIRDSLPNRYDSTPFRFEPEDLVEVITALHGYSASPAAKAFKSALDFDAIKVRDHKNKLNGLTPEYYQEIIVNGSMPHFAHVEDFLKNPRNRKYAELYHDAVDELKSKILLKRNEFANFDSVFAFLYEEIQRHRSSLKGKRRLISILLHYMYFTCDIGVKHGSSAGATNAQPPHQVCLMARAIENFFARCST